MCGNGSGPQVFNGQRVYFFIFYYNISATPLPKVVCVVTGAADNCDRFVIIIFFPSLTVSTASTVVVRGDLNPRFCSQFSSLFARSPSVCLFDRTCNIILYRVINLTVLAPFFLQQCKSHSKFDILNFYTT